MGVSVRKAADDQTSTSLGTASSRVGVAKAAKAETIRIGLFWMPCANNLQDKGLTMKKPPRHILGYLKNPETWAAATFETAIRNEVEGTTGPLTASDELLIGMLVLTVDTFLTAHINICNDGPVYQYNSGAAPSSWYKIRTESLDKSIKILAELALVARGRPKFSSKVSDVDELFATA